MLWQKCIYQNKKLGNKFAENTKEILGNRGKKNYQDIRKNNRIENGRIDPNTNRNAIKNIPGVHSTDQNTSD